MDISSSSDVDDELNPFKKHNKVQENEQSKKKFFKYKLTKQTVLVAIWISMGLMVGLIGPTLPDLKALMGVNYEEIARAYLGTSVGVFSGSILGGIVHERFYRFTDLVTGICTVVAAIGISLVPWMGGILPLFFDCCVLGLTLGATNAGGNTMVLHLWGTSSGPPMYALHFGFGLGGVLSPQIARPFLSDQNVKEDSANHTDKNNDIVGIVNYTTPYSSDSGKSHDHASTLFIPFLIVGIITAVIAIAMLVLFKIGTPEGYPKRKSIKNAKKLFSPQSCAAGAPCYGVIILILLFLYYMTTVGGETIYGKFIYAYTVESDIGISNSEATFLTSLFWLGHIAGRACSIIISKFIPITFFIFGDICMLIIVTIILAITVHPVILWILTPMFGFLVSPLFPAGMLWINNILQVNSMSIMICLVGTSFGTFFYIYTTGFMFEHVGPRSLMYIEVFHSTFLLFVFGALEFMGRKYLQKVKTVSANTEKEMTERKA